MIGAKLANLGSGGDRKSDRFKSSNDLLITQVEAARRVGGKLFDQRAKERQKAAGGKRGALMETLPQAPDAGTPADGRGQR
jgi:hypothetical protein